MPTSKQFGDAAEHRIISDLGFAGIPAAKMPDNWPHYDVVAQPDGRPPQTISVKARRYKADYRHYVTFNELHQFDWMAIVLLDCPGSDGPRVFIVPREVIDQVSTKWNLRDPSLVNQRAIPLAHVLTKLSPFEGDFSLSKP